MNQSLLSPATRRYAKALFLSTQERGEVAEVAQWMQTLERICGQPEIAKALVDPRLGGTVKLGLVEQGLESLHPLVKGLLEVLKRKKRLALLPEIPVAFGQYQDDFEGCLRGTLETSHPISEEEHAALEAAFSKSTGKQVSLTAIVNPALLGGVCVTLAGTRYDGSAQGRLEQYRSRLSAATLA